MPEESIEPDPPVVAAVVPAASAVVPAREGRPEIRCEFCKSKLDRRGGLIERGPKVRELMDAEDTINDLRKQLKKSEEAHEDTKREAAALRAELSPFKSRKFGHVSR